MRLSSRFEDGSGPNPISLARAALEARGAVLTDLTDSNPTRHGLGDPAVLEAVARAARRSGGYQPDPRGPVAAREALAGRYGGGPDDYGLTASTSEAYSWLFALLTDPGGVIAVPAPGYPLLEPLAGLALARTREYPYHYVHPHGWMLDVAELRRAAADARAVVAVNPGNPTGAYVDGSARAALVEACERAGAALIADQVFYPFALEAAGGGVNLAGGGEVLTFALDGLSKLLCAPQLKLGWLRLSGPEADVAAARAALDLIADSFLSVNSPVAGALPELLDLADGVAARTRDRLAGNLAALRSVLGDGGWRVRRVDGGWTALVDAPGGGVGESTVIWLMESAGLAVHPGWFYDLPGEGAVALSLLPEGAEFALGCRRLRAAFERLA
jgi:aspartate/methionine/tyrosine aminotransferase